MKRLIAVLLTLGLLAWLLGDARWRELADALTGLTPGMLAVGVAGFALSYVLRAGRVHDEFRAEARGRFASCLRIVLIHNALVNVVPFRGGEAAFPVLLQRTFGTPISRSIASLFWFRLQDAMVVAGLAILVWPDVPAALRAIAMTGLVGFAWYLPRWARAPHDWSNGRPLAAKLAKLRDAFAESTRHGRYGWLWTISSWSVKLAAQAWILTALLATALPIGAAGALGAELAAVLPVQGVAGFGTYEAAAAAALFPHGITFERGLQAALVLHLFVIACALSAGAVAALFPVRSAMPAASPRPPISGNS